MGVCRQAGIRDHLLPIFIDHFNVLTIYNMRWSDHSGKGWSKPAFLPDFTTVTVFDNIYFCGIFNIFHMSIF